MIQIKPRLFPLLLLLSLLLGSCQAGIKSLSLQSSKVTDTPRAPETSSQLNEIREDSENCPLQDPHPVAENIAEKYEREYEQIIEWYCAGFAFEDILLALQTSKLAEVDPENLLARLNHQSWDQIWDDFNLNP